MSTRRPLIAGNWKLNKPGPEAVAAAEQLATLVAGSDRVDIMIAPVFTALAPVAAVIADSPVALGGQDMFWETEGAFTGEISAPMLKAVGCRYVIIGHSERRQFFGETDTTVNRKVQAALKEALIPVMCIGESETEREQQQTFSVLDKQIRNGLHDVALNSSAQLVVAYEPIWAIGTGKTATSQQAQEVHAFLRGLLKELYGSLAEGIRILYGGSVKPANIAELMSKADVDGALVGGASLDPETFSQIVNYE